MHVISNKYASAFLLFLLGLALYSINLERPAHSDEFYHLLGARGLLATGAPAIGATGEYWRGFPLTWLVAQSFALFGDSVAVGRLPSVIITAALVAALFLFLHREAGVRAAWFGAGLYAVSPFAIGIAQFVRFYSVQCFLFFIAAWLIYSMMRSPFRAVRMVPFGILAALLLAAAIYFQPTTYFGLAGLAFWSASVVALPWLLDNQVSYARKRHVILGIAVVALVTLLGLGFSGILAKMWENYRSTSLFNRSEAAHFWYYYAWYMLFYPTLTTLTGLLTVAALIKSPRVTIFILAVFGVGFIFNSFAGPKNMRYIAYAEPFLFALWGIGLAALWTMGRDAIGRSRERLAAAGFALLPPPQAGRAATTILVLAGVFTVVANPAWLRSVTVLADITVPPELPSTRWEAAAPLLAPLLEEVEAVVTTDELGMLYFYGRADYMLNASRFQELLPDERQAFGRDVRTSVPVIDDPASLEAIMDCHASGLFIVPNSHWLDGARPQEEVLAVAELILARTERVELPQDSQLAAFVWDGVASADCAVPPASRPPGR